MPAFNAATEQAELQESQPDVIAAAEAFHNPPPAAAVMFAPFSGLTTSLCH